MLTYILPRFHLFIYEKNHKSKEKQIYQISTYQNKVLNHVSIEKDNSGKNTQKQTRLAVGNTINQQGTNRKTRDLKGH